MALELRPPWCMTDEAAREVLELSAWLNPDGSPAMANDGDDWAPGVPLSFHRIITSTTGANELRQSLGLEPGIGIGLAARWVCRATAAAGTHIGGPGARDFGPEARLDLEIPPHVADHIEVETCILARWLTDDHSFDSPPDGAVLWSDAWSSSRAQRRVLIEGSETRIPVQSVRFSERFPAAPEALWAIEIDQGTQPEDLVANSISVLLNEAVLERDFPDPEGRPDASRLTPLVQSGVQVDLITGLAHQILDGDEGDGAEDPWSDIFESDPPEGTVASLLNTTLLAAFGAGNTALGTLRDDPVAFSRQLWSTYAPSRWRT